MASEQLILDFKTTGAVRAVILQALCVGSCAGHQLEDRADIIGIQTAVNERGIGVAEGITEGIGGIIGKTCHRENITGRNIHNDNSPLFDFQIARRTDFALEFARNHKVVGKFEHTVKFCFLPKDGKVLFLLIFCHRSLFYKIGRIK